MTQKIQSRAGADQPRRTYTPDDVIHQSLVAFGQGTSFMRVSSHALRRLVAQSRKVLDERELYEGWGELAVQVLERLRAVGRVALALAVGAGRTYVDEDDVLIAMRKVRLMSKSTECILGDGEYEVTEPLGQP